MSADLKEKSSRLEGMKDTLLSLTAPLSVPLLRTLDAYDAVMPIVRADVEKPRVFGGAATTQIATNIAAELTEQYGRHSALKWKNGKHVGEIKTIYPAPRELLILIAQELKKIDSNTMFSLDSETHPINGDRQRIPFRMWADLEERARSLNESKSEEDPNESIYLLPISDLATLKLSVRYGRGSKRYIHTLTVSQNDSDGSLEKIDREIKKATLQKEIKSIQAGINNLFSDEIILKTLVERTNSLTAEVSFDETIYFSKENLEQFLETLSRHGFQLETKKTGVGLGKNEVVTIGYTFSKAFSLRDSSGSSSDTTGRLNLDVELSDWGARITGRVDEVAARHLMAVRQQEVWGSAREYCQRALSAANKDNTWRVGILTKDRKIMDKGLVGSVVRTVSPNASKSTETALQIAVADMVRREIPKEILDSCDLGLDAFSKEVELFGQRVVIRAEIQFGVDQGIQGYQLKIWPIKTANTSR